MILCASPKLFWLAIPNINGTIFINKPVHTKSTQFAGKLDELVNPFMPVAAKTAWQFWWYLSYKCNFQKIVEGEMYFRTLKIFCKCHASFQSYLQRCHMSRRSSCMNGSISFYFVLWWTLVIQLFSKIQFLKKNNNIEYLDE